MMEDREMISQASHEYTDAQRMELRSFVELASEVIAQYWPMRTFIHHNPLHGLETMPFEQAVQRGRELFGGRGYLDSDEYRRLLKIGRILLDDVQAVLQPLALDKHIMFAGRRFSHVDILVASLVHGVTEERSPPSSDIPADDPVANRLVSWLERTAGYEPAVADGSPSSLNRSDHTISEPLSTWCDRSIGTAIVDTINREMVKWCSVFLDEGEATWTMPEREQTFYRAWKSLAGHDLTLRLLGIKSAAKHIAALPDRPEDALLNALARMRVPQALWEQYLSGHLAALPGWSGYIKWRAHHSTHPWQQAFPIDLVKYLAVRLFYEGELVQAACRSHLALDGHGDAIRQYMDRYPHAYRLRRAAVAGLVLEPISGEVRRLAASKTDDHEAWEELGRRYDAHERERQGRQRLVRSAQSLVRLAQVHAIQPSAIEATPPSDITLLLRWLEEFPASRHGSTWLKALEASHRRRILDDLQFSTVAPAAPEAGSDSSSRPLAQVVFCIDVRSEVFRRQLERLGGYETLGLAGFFGVPLDYQSLNVDFTVSHCPVLLKPRNTVREVPRSYHSAVAERHKHVSQLSKAASELLHDLKENVVTPYVMVEAVGWFFSLPLFGRTLFPVWYNKVRHWFARTIMPHPATTLTVEKLAREEAEEMVTTEQHAVIREVLRERFGAGGTTLSSGLLEKIRKKATGNAEEINGEIAKALNLSPEAEVALYQELRDRHRISPRGIAARLNRLTRTGFSIPEQAYFVEAALRLMGLTSNFSRLVLFCAHGSTSQNNPYESALDCGACGGNQGLPNARTIAAMANKGPVRDLLRERGIKIPSATQFLAAEHDTTTDTVRIVDLEDVPPTHRKDLQRLMSDLRRAGEQASLERANLLPQPSCQDPSLARQLVRRRSEDWAEVRPEWGLSKNSVMIIGRRTLTHQLNLEGRIFLHSYDFQQDPSGKLLETIMTAPLVVAQWINMEHYFSTVDNEVYGSGSKVYHNVVGRIGVMTGVWSDLRIGLPAQTVLNGPVPYHEPMRLLALIEAPLTRIQAIIARHPLLTRLVNLQWVTLVALDPEQKAVLPLNPEDRLNSIHPAPRRHS
jgi:uncharacterized protein YbcC (UPF0753/DUF2309 family)